MKGVCEMFSYALGFVAALPEYGPRRFFPKLQPMTRILAKMAPDGGRFTDGYDRAADWRCKLPC